MNIERPQPKQLIPPESENVYSGRLFQVYQWQQPLFDGTFKIFEAIRRPDSVNIIPITDNGEIILCEEMQPGKMPAFGCLGGMIDNGETPIEAAQRELAEEAGLTAENLTLWDATQLTEKVDHATYTFIARGVRKNVARKSDPGERINLVHSDFERFVELVTHPGFRDVEVALLVFRSILDPNKLSEMKKLLSL